MFKKVLLTFAIIFLVIGIITAPITAQTMTTGGVGWITQKGAESKAGYVVGLGIPIMSDTTKSIMISNETDFMYVEKQLGDINELTIIRTFFMTTKYLPYNFHIKMGTGGWKIINTAGPDIDSFALRFGTGWEGSWPWDITISAALDIVRTDGPDLYAPSFTITLLGL